MGIDISLIRPLQKLKCFREQQRYSAGFRWAAACLLKDKHEHNVMAVLESEPEEFRDSFDDGAMDAVREFRDLMKR